MGRILLGLAFEESERWVHGVTPDIVMATRSLAHEVPKDAHIFSRGSIGIP